jgi:hypothetical protein
VSKITIWMCIIGVTLIGFGFLGYREFFGPPDVVWRSQIRSGNQLISRVESFRKVHGHLPSAQSEIDLNVTEQSRILYKKCTDTRYVVWFGTELGESMSYDSGSGVWKPINVTCQ